MVLIGFLSYKLTYEFATYAVPTLHIFLSCTVINAKVANTLNIKPTFYTVNRNQSPKKLNHHLSPTPDYSLARHPTIPFNGGLRGLFCGELGKLGTIMPPETHPDCFV